MKKKIDYFEFKSLSKWDKAAVISDRGCLVKRTKHKTIFMVHDYFAEVEYTIAKRDIRAIKILYSFDLTGK
jgi:hypothetical protein